MKANEEFEELKRLLKYRNMSFGAENEFYNDLMRKMEKEYCRWYGSAYNLYHRDIVKLRDDISQAKLHSLNGRKNLLTQTYALIWGWDRMTQYRLLKRK